MRWDGTGWDGDDGDGDDDDDDDNDDDDDDYDDDDDDDDGDDDDEGGRDIQYSLTGFFDSHVADWHEERATAGLEGHGLPLTFGLGEAPQPDDLRLLSPQKT